MQLWQADGIFRLSHLPGRSRALSLPVSAFKRRWPSVMVAWTVIDFDTDTSCELNSTEAPHTILWYEGQV